MQSDNPIEERLQKWEEQKGRISEFFKDREKNLALEPMKESFLLFLEVLFLGNGKTLSDLLNWEIIIEDLELKPVNAKERLMYIHQSPNHYHSFIQLQQLFMEFQKSYQITKLGK